MKNEDVYRYDDHLSLRYLQTLPFSFFFFGLGSMSKNLDIVFMIAHCLRSIDIRFYVFFFFFLKSAQEEVILSHPPSFHIISKVIKQTDQSVFAKLSYALSL